MTSPISGRLATLALVTGLAICGAVSAETPGGPVALVDFWARATPAGAPVGAAYGSIRNTGTEPDRLVAAEVAVAARAELHETVMADGIARMRPLEGIAIPAGSTFALRPGGPHLMLTGLKEPLREGDRFTGTLVFERAGRVPATFSVRPIGAGAGHGSHSGH